MSKQEKIKDSKAKEENKAEIQKLKLQLKAKDMLIQRLRGRIDNYEKSIPVRMGKKIAKTRIGKLMHKILYKLMKKKE